MCVTVIDLKTHLMIHGCRRRLIPVMLFVNVETRLPSQLRHRSMERGVCAVEYDWHPPPSHRDGLGHDPGNFIETTSFTVRFFFRADYAVCQNRRVDISR